MGWLWCNNLVEFDQMWFIFQHKSPLPSTHFFHLCCSVWIPMVAKLSSWSSKKVLKLQIYYLIIGLILLPSQVFLHVGEQKIDCAKSGEYGGWLTSSKPQSCTAAIATTYMCAGALSWWNRTAFISFPGCFEMSLCTTCTFKVLNYLSSVSLSGRKQCT